MSRPIIRYETERLILKPTGVEDAAFILALLNSPGWLEHVGDRNVHTVEEASKYINDRMLPQYEKIGYGNYTVIRKSDNAKVGTSGIYARPGIEDVDIGFSVLPDYMGQGYSYEAAVKLMHLAEHSFGINKITAITTKANIPSQNLIKKLGMKYIQDVKIDGDDEILMQFGIAF